MEDAQAKVMWTISATFLNETPLTSLEPLIALQSGDLTRFEAIVANMTRAIIPQSSALGVMSNAITSTQKDIQGGIIKYVQNKIPIASSFLPDQRDIWTNLPLNDISNPFLRLLNAMSPIKVSDGNEPWRDWLRESGWDGLGRLKMDTTGSYEYTEEQREWIYKRIGQMELYRGLIPLMKDKELNKLHCLFRAHRATGQDLENPMIKLKTQKLPLFTKLDKLIDEAHMIAEKEWLAMNKDVENTIIQQQKVDHQMKQGDVQGAHDTQKKELETRKLLQMAK